MVALGINELKSHLARARVYTGAAGEMMVTRALEARGYEVSRDRTRGDLKVITPDGEIVGVEVKTARKCSDGKWRFLLRKDGHQDHRKSDVVIMLCVMRTGDVVPFVVPTSVLVDQRQAVITSLPYTYAGKLAAYRQRMHELSITFEIYG